MPPEPLEPTGPRSSSIFTLAPTARLRLRRSPMPWAWASPRPQVTIATISCAHSTLGWTAGAGVEVADVRLRGGNRRPVVGTGEHLYGRLRGPVQRHGVHQNQIAGDRAGSLRPGVRLVHALRDWRRRAGDAPQRAPSAGEAPTLVSTQAAPRQAPPRQVASAVNDLPGIADSEVIYTDDFVTETKPARQVAKKRPYKEEDESARMKRIMSICSAC